MVTSRASARNQSHEPIGELVTGDQVVGHPDERLFDDVVRMAEHDIEQLQIVGREDEGDLARLARFTGSDELCATAAGR